MSDQKTTENFWQAWAQPAPEPKPVSFRLYHDKNGNPLYYSMEEFPDNYIEVDPQAFIEARMDVRVIAGKLVKIAPKITVKKLKPTNHNGISCHTNDICVIVAKDYLHTKWKLTENEIN